MILHGVIEFQDSTLEGKTKTYTIDNWELGDLTWYWGESLVAKPGDRGAAFFEHRVKENSKSGWEFNNMTCVTKPSCPKDS